MLLNGQAVLADPELMSLAERIAKTMDQTACVTRAYSAALADARFTDAERHTLLLELEMLIAEAREFQDVLQRVEVQ